MVIKVGLFLAHKFISSVVLVEYTSAQEKFVQMLV